MFAQIKIKLNDDYRIVAVKETNDVAVTIYNNQTIVGRARLTTDNIDASCITSLSVDDKHINCKFNQQYTLGDILLKFLIKFPTVVRKPEFRFVLDVPENFEPIVAKYHFDRGVGTNLEKEILVRQKSILPEKCTYPDEVIFKRAIRSDEMEDLLLLLQKNAYWQPHLTLVRLKLLVNNSQCFFAKNSNDKIIGFSRVVTNNTSFASLWDVVVDESYRKKGIGTSMMMQVFSDTTLSKIANWVLFTDTAKSLYEKFGFVSEREIPERKLVHKLRLQEEHPAYMNELIQVTEHGLLIDLDEKRTFNYLYGASGKRAKLSSLWKEVALVENTPVNKGETKVSEMKFQ